ncbi:aminodeoxychorismate synthase component I [Draconibacterium halophilum]|uniref:Aminodeoxychorismate synthase component I n=1 Tax=Draconibacterium halophilum TaxID=2706887 RepID=A0A6C0RF63_9BACT|nr:aminodeoxychorismate synthase component I [Draconibacterium halophilum]QIA08596.1 aminodeoxychorismate synthase component I [Draconibacterium halophilum]
MRGKKTIAAMNELGRKKEAFVFVIDFNTTNFQLFKPHENDKILWQANKQSNFTPIAATNKKIDWETEPVSFNQYQKGYELVQQHIHNGDTYLLNYTQPTTVKTNLSPEEIFHLSEARYKVLLKDQFVCFSPEIFVQIDGGKISSYPMKGTMDASLPNAKERILNDSKELAEHNTIVDLIRNDLSLVADNVTVDKFRYLERLKTNQRDLWQVSSKISGDLPKNYTEQIGDIIFKMLPAGSICGAPKKKTVEIIKAAENYDRGFYTGIFGYFDGQNLDSCVLIRYLEKQNDQLVYKSGGGITFLSDAESEYEELVKKVYIPVFRKD